MSLSLSTIIITPLSGAVIGYFTNWLAVKMLFRPHEEKKLFGFRLPFTPGLVPKERFRLSKRIGETLSANVLTEEELNKAVSSPEVAEKLLALLDGFLANLREGAYDAKTEELCGLLAARLCAALENENGAVSSLAASLYGRLKDFLLTECARYLGGEEFNRRLKELVSGFVDKLRANDARLGSYVPEWLLDSARRFLSEKTPDAAALIRSLTERFPDLDEKLRELVAKVARDNLGSFLGLFIHYDQLYGKIKESLFKYLDDPENQRLITEKGLELLDRLLDREVRELASRLSPDAGADMADGVASLVKNGVGAGIITRLVEGMDGSIEAAGGRPDVAGLLKRLVPDLEETVKKLLHNASRAVMRAAGGQNAEKLRDFAMKALRLIVAKGGAYVVNALEFDKIVENKINDFSVAEAEDIIMSVTDRELKAITRLGAVLGLVIGFVPLLMQMFTGS